MGDRWICTIGGLAVGIEEESFCDGCTQITRRTVLVFNGPDGIVSFCQEHAREALEQLRFFIQGGVQG